MMLILSMSLDDGDNRRPEVIAGHLFDVAYRVQAGHGTGHIYDVNGNKIGAFNIVDDDEAESESRPFTGDSGKFAT